MRVSCELFPFLRLQVTSFPPIPREAVRGLRASKIREVANAGLAREDVLAFWFGEPDEVTPAFIRQAGVDALHAGETFYTHNLGIPELREAIASYVSACIGRPGSTRSRSRIRACRR